MMTPIVDSYSEIFSNKKKILVVFAHPDDLELYCGGTVARLVADGKQVRSIKMTSGEMGCRLENVTSEELMKIREEEDSASMRELGIKDEDNIYFRLGDGKVENNFQSIGEVVKQIRLFQPDLIITHNSSDLIIRFGKGINWFNHRDHRNTGSIVIDASYPFARDILFYSEQFEDPKVKSWSCTQFLLVDSYGHEDAVFIDITDHVARRVAAHAKHKSQYSEADAQESADFFTKNWDETGLKNFETFRFVNAD